jgi:GNAT superfamily N-acetyltransferase
MILESETTQKYGYTVATLRPSSQKKVVFKCDYCGTIGERAYGQICKKRKNLAKDCCTDGHCISLKREESTKLKYGVKNVIYVPEIQSKLSATRYQRFGGNSPFSSPSIHLKAQQSRNNGSVHEILEFINSFGYDFKQNVSFHGKVLDGLDSTRNLAFRYCRLKDSNEHADSTKTRKYAVDFLHHCESHGVRLFTIFEDEWINRQKQVKGFLQSVLDKHTSKSIAARKCECIEYPKDLTRRLLDSWHIQGQISAISLSLTLIYESEPVGIITFSRHHRNNDPYVSVLSRLAFAQGVHINGGASKLFRHALPMLQERGIKKIVSWSDSRWSQGNVYQKLGFTLGGILDPDYSYVQLKGPLIRVSKQSMKNVTRKEGQSEKDACLDQGLARIWDCGKKLWVCHIK